MYHYNFSSGAYNASRESTTISKLYIKVPWGYLVIDCFNSPTSINNFRQYGTTNGANHEMTYYFK